MGEATRKKEATRSLKVGDTYGEAGIYVGHGVAILVDHDLKIGGISRYYEFERGSIRKRLQTREALELLRKIDTGSHSESQQTPP